MLPHVAFIGSLSSFYRDWVKKLKKLFTLCPCPWVLMGFSLESAIFIFGKFNNACHAHITLNDPHHPIVNMTPVVLFKCFQKLK